MDVDQDTYVKAESTAGTDNDELWFYTAGNSRMRILNNGKIGIATNSPTVSLEINATDSIKIPKGTTAQRPGAPSTGMLRYNSTDTDFEGYTDKGWVSIGAEGTLHNVGKNSKVEITEANQFNVNLSGSNILSISQSKVGINQSSPSYSLEINATDSLKIPLGTTAERPGTTTNGLFRYNTTLNEYEGYSNGSWVSISSGKSLYSSNRNSNLTVSENQLIFQASSNNAFYINYNKVAINSNQPNVTLDITGSDAIKIPTGTTAQRPSTTSLGQIRYNTTANKYEGYTSGGWSELSGGGGSTTTIGNPTTGGYVSNPQLNSGDTISDGFQTVTEWIYKNLIDKPPAPTVITTSTDTVKITISWTNPTQFELGMLDITVPKINEIRVDFKQSSQLDSSYVTINTGSTTTNEVIFHIEGSGTGLSGNTYNYYTITKETQYDFRIYAVNDNSSSTTHYLNVTNLATQGIGIPSSPTNLSGSTSSSTSVYVSWTKPTYHDATNSNTSSPYIERYKIHYTAQSSTRYGGVITHDSAAYTTATTTSNSSTSKTVSSLNPGTVYNLEVASKNTQNSAGGSNSDGYSAYSSSIQLTTNNPSAPSYLSSSNCNSINSISTLRSPYGSSAYSLDGITSISDVLRYSTVLSNGLETVSSPSVRTNATIGGTSTGITTFYSYAGLNSDYTTHVASTTIDGFSNANKNGTYTNTKVELIVSNDQDYYTSGSTNNQGFYKSAIIKGKIRDISTNFVASVSKYSMQTKQSVTGGSTVSTNRIDFYIDNLNNSPVITNLQTNSITLSSTSYYEYISGILTLKQGATFNLQFNLEHLGNYFLRSDKTHADISIKKSSGTGSLISSTLSITRSDISLVGNKYYITPANGYATSSTLYNTNGYTLDATNSRGKIQFKDFTVDLNSSANNIFDEDVQLSGIPYNLYGTGATVTGEVIDTSNGNSKGDVRIDTVSSQTKSSIQSASSTYGLHVRSGYDSSTTYYPSGPGTGNSDFGDTYDDTADISSTSNPRYDTELQLVNGRFRASGTSYAYKNYGTTYYKPESLTTYSFPNYSSVLSATTTFRYITFKYTGRISNASGCTIDFINTSNFGTTVKPTDITLHIKIVNSGTSSNNTGWLDANSTVSGVGINATNKVTDGTPCLSTSGSSSSTSTKKYCYLHNPTTGDLYVKLGIKLSSTKNIQYIQVTNDFV